VRAPALCILVNESHRVVTHSISLGPHVPGDYRRSVSLEKRYTGPKHRPSHSGSRVAQAAGGSTTSPT